MSVEQLLVLFKSGGCRRTALRTSHFVGPCLCLKTMPGRSTTASKRRHHKTGEDKSSVPKGIIFPHHPAALHQSKRPITQMRKPFFRHQPKLDKLTSFLGRGPKQKRSVFGRRGARAKAQSSPPCSFTLYRSPKDHLSPKAKTTEPSANKPFGSPALLTTESVLLCSPRDTKRTFLALSVALGISHGGQPKGGYVRTRKLRKRVFPLHLVPTGLRSH